MTTRLKVLLGILVVVLICAGYWLWQNTEATTKEVVAPVPTKVEVVEDTSMEEEESEQKEPKTYWNTYVDARTGFSFVVGDGVRIVESWPNPAFPEFTQLNLFEGNADEDFGFIYINAPAHGGPYDTIDLGEREIQINGEKYLVEIYDFYAQDGSPEGKPFALFSISVKGNDYRIWLNYTNEAEKARADTLFSSLSFR